MSSCFINDPFPKIEKSLAKLDFFPVQQQRLTDLATMFGPSKIIEPSHLTVTFLTEILPANSRGFRLLYQHSNEMALARKEFQRWEHLQKLANKQNYRQTGKVPKPHLINQNSEIGILLTGKETSSGPISGENQPELQVALSFNAPKRFHDRCDY